MSDPSTTTDRFTIRDNGKWGWLVRDVKAGADLLTGKLDEAAAQSLADELNATPPRKPPVYADPPYPDDAPPADAGQDPIGADD